MPAGDEPTLGEILRRLERIERKLDEGSVFLRTERYEAEDKATQRRIQALEEFQARLTWGIVLAFIGLLTEGAVIAFKVMGR